MDNESYELAKNNLINIYNNRASKFENLKKQLETAINNDDERLIGHTRRIMQNELSILKTQLYHINYMRPNLKDDIDARNQIIDLFPKTIKEVIPNDIPYVFHGNSNIGTVLEIIKEGGLFTPEERGVDSTSFASQIDVTSKNNIRVSCEFAEPNSHTFMPYGAIFVFLPQEDEIEKVISTNDSSEVYGGVKSINFTKNPEKLIGVITTLENKNIISKYLVESGLDKNKVFTHDEFVLDCINKFSNFEAVRSR